MTEPRRRNLPESDAGNGPDLPKAAEIEEVRQILHIFANAVSASRLYPPEHQSVRDFISLLYERLRSFLQSHWKLELVVEEDAFLFLGERVYVDSHPVRSLPFFFHKDGLKSLFFYQGLQEEEVGEFLQIIRQVSLQPPEEADIVNALWEKDLANIRYFAPDDFLETKIGGGQPAAAIQVNQADLSRGRIELLPDDLDALTGSLQQATLPDRLRPVLDEDDLSAGTTQEEVLKDIESLLLSNRRLSPHEEYLNLIIEIIYQEDRADQFPAIAQVLEQYHRDALNKRDYGRAASLLRSLQDMKAELAKTDASKARVISDWIGELVRGDVLSSLWREQDRASAEEKKALVEYLAAVGRAGAETIAVLYEKWTEPSLRRQLLDLLQQIGKADVNLLMCLAQESRPELSRALIPFVSQIEDRGKIPFLASFLSSRHAAVKLEAVRALGQIEDRSAARILFGYLSSAEREVRLAALRNLRIGADGSLVDSLLRLAAEKSFLKKDREEIQAFFDCLARSDSADAVRYLRKIMLKRSILPSKKRLRTRLSAVQALSRMSRPEAREALREGTACWAKRVRLACREALGRNDSEAE